ncbi:MAG: hypothetical protein B6I30_00470 [Desulfobacteraceae bacterium 4572_187]|nr:MAG: hypothetical protein B6I30_00470 [Desulfobacteraceae bacterium 4572_187]
MSLETSNNWFAELKRRKRAIGTYSFVFFNGRKSEGNRLVLAKSTFRDISKNGFGNLDIWNIQVKGIKPAYQKWTMLLSLQ